MQTRAVKVKSVKYVDASPTVCDITVADNHNLFVCSNLDGKYALAHNCLDENVKQLSKAGINEKGQGPFSLDFMTTQYGCNIYYEIAFSKSDRGNMVTTELNDALIAYACYDVVVIFQMMEFQRAEAKRQGQKMFMQLMLYQFDSMLKAFSTAEYNGVLMDKQHLHYLMSKESPIKKLLKEVEGDMQKDPAYQKANDILLSEKNLSTGHGLFGIKPWIFKVKKAAHKMCLFFDVLELEPLSMNKSGKAGKIDKKFQEKYADIPGIKLFTQHSKLSMLLNTFIGDVKKGLYGISIKDPDTRKDGRLRSHYDFKDVLTGRNSSRNPNLQNISQHDKLAKHLKRLFIAAIRNLLLEVDYSAHEVREWANISGDRDLANAFKIGMKLKLMFRLNPSSKLKAEIEEKGDIHRINHKHFYGRFPNDKKERNSIKSVVFGTIYGKTAAGLAVALGISEEQAQALIDLLFVKFKNGGKFLTNVCKRAARTFTALSPIGRVRHLWGYMHNRTGVINAMNRRGPNCVDEKTQCLTKNGWKYYKQLKVGDKIYTKNAKTGDLELQPITDLTISDYKGKMWQLSGDINALVTPNHRWLVDYIRCDSGVKYKNPEFVTSEFIQNSGNNNSIHLVADSNPQEGNNSWTDTEVSIIGGVLTDGYYDTQIGRTRVFITQSCRGNPQKVAIIDALMEKSAIDYKRSGPDSSFKIKWAFTGELALRIRETFPNKLLTTRFLRSLSYKQLTLLYDAMMLGNGAWNKSLGIYDSFAAGTKTKANRFQVLCALIGVPTSLTGVKPKDPSKYKKYDSMPNIAIQKQTCWLVEIKQRKRAQAKFYSSWVDYNGIVWCPTVKNGSFIARRNGSVYVTGNSIIQGMASDILQHAATALTDMIWHFYVKHDVPFFGNHDNHPMGPNNYVHDSIKSDVNVIHIPIYMYLLEHACTTRVHRDYRKIYGHKMLVGLEIEFSFGATADDMYDAWDWNTFSRDVFRTVKDKEGKDVQERVPCLVEIIEMLLGKAAVLYPDYWTASKIKSTMTIFVHNLKIVDKIRRAEIKETLKLNKNPSEIMHLNEKNARSFGLIFTAEEAGPGVIIKTREKERA